MADLTLAQFSRMNRDRCKAWMGDADTLHHHVIGLAGEVGEVCNAVKKIDRIKNGRPRSEPPSADEISDEIADVLIYLDLVAAHFHIDLAFAVAHKFNETSAKYGFPHRLPMPGAADGSGEKGGERG